MSKLTKSSKAAPAKNGFTPAITSDFIEKLVDDIMEMTDHFKVAENIDSSMNGTERLRLFGPGVRNYGFMDKAWDIAHDNPMFTPPNMNVQLMGKTMRDIEDLRQLAFVLEQFLQVVNDLMLLKSDETYRMALRIYGSLREQTRNRVPGAAPLFEALLMFFRRRRRMEEGEPTVKELEHDFKRLVHGTADGEIIIKNEQPHVSGGIREVIDNVHTGRVAAKATEEIEVDDNSKRR
ncbi:MAG: hypothetical protein FWG29_02200 [Treponema sp.]|nr:hypothetical protein [Treponema sp.]